MGILFEGKAVVVFCFFNLCFNLIDFGVKPILKIYDCEESRLCGKWCRYLRKKLG